MSHTIGIYFELKNPGAQSPGLKNYLESFDGFTQAGERLWFVLTDKTTSEINTELNSQPFMQANGYMAMVFRIGQDWHYHGYDQAADDWLKEFWTV